MSVKNQLTSQEEEGGRKEEGALREEEGGEDGRTKFPYEPQEKTSFRSILTSMRLCNAELKVPIFAFIKYFKVQKILIYGN